MIELNRIYNEDCLEGMNRISDNTVDLVVTDPPYCIGTTSNGQKGILVIGNSFGKEDLDTAVKANLKEIRAVTPTYTFSMKRPKGGWRVSSEEFRKTYSKVNSEVRAEFEERMRRGTSPKFLEVRHYHEVSKRIANIYGWEYSKRKG